MEAGDTFVEKVRAELPKFSSTRFLYFHKGFFTPVRCTVQRQGDILGRPTEDNLKDLELPRSFWQVCAEEDIGPFKEGMKVLTLCIEDRREIMRTKDAKVSYPASSDANGDNVRVVSVVDPESLAPHEREDICLFYFETVEMLLYKHLEANDRIPSSMPRGCVLHSQSWGSRNSGQRKNENKRKPTKYRAENDASEYREGQGGQKRRKKRHANIEMPQRRHRKGDLSEADAFTDEDAEAPTPFPSAPAPAESISAKSITDVMHNLNRNPDMAKFPPGADVVVINGHLRAGHLIKAKIVVQGDFFETSTIKNAADMMVEAAADAGASDGKTVKKTHAESESAAKGKGKMKSESRVAGTTQSGETLTDKAVDKMTEAAAQMMTDFPVQFWQVRVMAASKDPSLPVGCNLNVFGLKTRKGAENTEYTFVYHRDYEKDVYQRLSCRGRMNFLRNLKETANEIRGRIVYSEPLVSRGAHCSDMAASASKKGGEEGADDSGKDPRAKVAKKFAVAAREKLGARHGGTSSSSAVAAHNAKQAPQIPDCSFRELNTHLPTCPLYDVDIKGVNTGTIAPNPDFVDWIVEYFQNRPPNEILRHFLPNVSAQYARWIAGDD